MCIACWARGASTERVPDPCPVAMLVSHTCQGLDLDHHATPVPADAHRAKETKKSNQHSCAILKVMTLRLLVGAGCACCSSCNCFSGCLSRHWTHTLESQQHTSCAAAVQVCHGAGSCSVLVSSGHPAAGLQETGTVVLRRPARARHTWCTLERGVPQGRPLWPMLWAMRALESAESTLCQSWTASKLLQGHQNSIA